MSLFLLGSMLLLVTSLADASCPDKEAMADFNQERFLGLWYNVREPELESPGWGTIKCAHSLLRHGEGSAIKSRYMFLNGTGSREYQNISGSLSRPADSTHGNLEGRFGEEQIPMKYYVLGTDYNNYATVWLCRAKPQGEGVIELAVVMSRHKTLDPAHLAQANSLLPEGSYRDSNQSDCPDHHHGGHGGHRHGEHASHEHGGHGSHERDSHESGEHDSHEHSGHHHHH